MDEQEEKYGVPLFIPVVSETIVVNMNAINSTAEVQRVYSYTDMVEVSYGDKRIEVHETEIEGLPW